MGEVFTRGNSIEQALIDVINERMIGRLKSFARENGIQVKFQDVGGEECGEEYDF